MTVGCNGMLGTVAGLTEEDAAAEGREHARRWEGRLFGSPDLSLKLASEGIEVVAPDARRRRGRLEGGAMACPVSQRRCEHLTEKR